MLMLYALSFIYKILNYSRGKQPAPGWAHPPVAGVHAMGHDKKQSQ